MFSIKNWSLGIILSLISMWLTHAISMMYYGIIKRTAGEAGRQLHKNVASNIEQVLAATPNKALTIRPPASHHKNYPS